MRRGLVFVTAWMWVACGVRLASGRVRARARDGFEQTRACLPVRQTSAGTSADREVVPYAGEPADMRPYTKFAAPYDTNYTRPNIYVGAARDIPTEGFDRDTHWLLRPDREQL